MSLSQVQVFLQCSTDVNHDGCSDTGKQRNVQLQLIESMGCVYAKLFLCVCAGGVPGAPNTTLEGSTLSWTEPMTNGEEIEEYTVRFR